MVDSGMLSGLSLTDPDRQLYHRALAQQVGLPLTIIDKPTQKILEQRCRSLNLLNGSLSFRDFCSAPLDRLSGLRSEFSTLGSEQIMPQNYFAHPLYRHMKDHLCVRLFEWIHLVREAERLGSRDFVRSAYLLEGSQFETFVFSADTDLVVIGPIFTQTRLGEGIARPHYSLMRTELEAFNGNVRRFWRSRETVLAAQRDPAIYTVDYLRNVSFQRPRCLSSLIEHRIDLIRTLMTRLEEVKVTCMNSAFSPRAAVKSIAALAAVDEVGASGLFRTKRFEASTCDAITVAVSPSSMAVVKEAFHPTKAYEMAYGRKMEAALTNWAASLSESMTRLRHWLLSTQSSGEHVTSKQKQDFGRRLARFLASAFEAYECTIYAVSHERGADKLKSIGSFSADKFGSERLAEMNKHMEGIAGTAKEVDSISFRCLRSNPVQYCQAYDYERRVAIPKDQRITYPVSPHFESWGRSACAIPIRSNGIMWGVLQLIGRRPHAFPEFIRARAEEACDIIGSRLFHTELIDSVHEITRIMSSSEVGTGEKRLAVEQCLSRMFGSKTFAIVRLDPSNPETASVFLHSGRDDLTHAAERDYGKDSCGILTQQPLTRMLADVRRQVGRTVAAQAAC